MGHAAAAAVFAAAALVASQKQHRAWIVYLHPLVNAVDEPGQTASTVFQVFGMSRPRITPSPSDLVTLK